MEDVARANLAALHRVLAVMPSTYEAYNVCSGRPVTILNVARRVASGMPGGEAVLPEPQVTGGFRLGDVRHVVASPDAARERLGFTAQVPPEVGLPRLARDPLRA